METLCWILGRGGLLGRSLRKTVGQAGMSEFVPDTPFRWQDEEACAVQMTATVAAFSAAAAGKYWRIYWAAGTGTMGSTEENLLKETRILTLLLSALSAEPSLTESDGMIVYASSAGAIYAGCRDDIITEHSETRPENAYGRAKIAEEELLKTFRNSHPSLSLVIARITNLYGAAQSSSKRQGLISHIARSILKRQPVNIFVPFDTIRDYIPADSAAAMMVRTAESIREPQAMTKIIASEEPTTIARIIGAFTTITRIPPRVITSVSPLSSSYPHRMCFRSVVGPDVVTGVPLLVGVSEVLAAERQALMRG